MSSPELTVVSHGMGQDSTTILHMIINDPAFRKRYAPRDLIVIFAETGDEHDETYEHLVYTKQLCLDNDILFVHVTPDLGYHPTSWQSLNYFYDTKKAVGSKAFPKTCTDNLKLVPIYKFLEQYVGDTYQFPVGRKKAFKLFAHKYGKIRVLIGIAKGEEKRMADPEKEMKAWKRDAIEVSYPLVDIGFGRQECQDYMRDIGVPIPMPSNCKRCPFMSEQELLWLYRFESETYHDWVRQERVKLDDNLHMGDRNLGVWGKKTLPEVLIVAQRKYGSWSDEQLMDYKMSHGHCVASKY